jgi:preprotein translocase subunit YajC
LSTYSLQPSQTAPPPPGVGQPTVPVQGPPPPANGPAPPAGGGSSLLLMLVVFLPFILFMYFTSRSQQKKQKDLESKLKKGDRVVTQSGLVGKLIENDPGRHVRVEIAPGVKVQMLKSAIAGLDVDESSSAKNESVAPGDKR